MTGRTIRALFGMLVILSDGFLVYKQVGSGAHFELNDLVFHLVAFVGGLLLIDYRVGTEVLSKVSRKFRRVE
jgi:hypothetical protein